MAKLKSVRIFNEYLGEGEEVEQDWKFNEYKTTVKYGNRQLTLKSFKMGMGLSHEPGIEDVMSCLVADYDVADMDFKEFCENCGYDTDSKTAERVYKDVKKYALGTRKLFGEDLVEIMEKYSDL